MSSSVGAVDSATAAAEATAEASPHTERTREKDLSDSEEELNGGGAFHQSSSRQSALSGRMDYAALGGSGRLVEQRQGKPQRRGLLAAHFAFKTTGTALYLFAGLIGLGYISTFVFVVLLLSVDFWLVKNLSGRLLAGLRWWSVTDHGTGKMIWRFEAWTPEERQVAYRSQVNLFWAGLLAQQALWTILFLSAVFSLKLGWLVIAFIACALNGANLYGYVRCRIQQPQSEQPGLLKRMADGLSGMFRGAGGTYTQGQQQSDYSGFAGGGGAAP